MHVSWKGNGQLYSCRKGGVAYNTWSTIMVTVHVLHFKLSYTFYIAERQQVMSLGGGGMGKREGNTHPEEVIQTCPEMVGEGDYLIQVGGGEGQKCAQEPGGGGGEVHYSEEYVRLL